MKPMVPEIKQKLVEALLSGNYEQTTKNLRDEIGYCCLGVLCDILKERLSLDVSLAENGLTSFGGETKVLPEEVMEAANIQTVDGTFWIEDAELEEGGCFTSLAEENDKGKTFEEIAKLIQTHF